MSLTIISHHCTIYNPNASFSCQFIRRVSFSCLQDLRAINRMIQINKNKEQQITGKRISLLDEGSKDCPSKKMRGGPEITSSALSKKLEGIVSERQAKNNSM